MFRKGGLSQRPHTGELPRAGPSEWFRHVNPPLEHIWSGQVELRLGTLPLGEQDGTAAVLALSGGIILPKPAPGGTGTVTRCWCGALLGRGLSHGSCPMHLEMFVGIFNFCGSEKRKA